MLSKRTILVLASGLAAALLFGCQNEEITHYQVPKEDRSQRLVAVILPRGEESWFFKLIGSPALVAKQKDAFEHFVHSVRFTNHADRPLRYDVPAGWKEMDPDQAFGQVALFRIRDGDQSAMLSVSHAGGDVLSNVNRWRTQQLGLRPVAPAGLATVTKETKINGDAATLVDMTSAGRIEEEPETDAAAPLKYSVPEGWKKVPPTAAFQLAVFTVTDGDRSATVSVSVLGGGVLENVNRWRIQQLGLEAWTQDQLHNEGKRLDVAGSPGDYVDLAGPEREGRTPRILGVIVPRGGQSLFFKMTGPADLVGKQKAAFEAFVKSVQFVGVNHE